MTFMNNFSSGPVNLLFPFLVEGVFGEVYDTVLINDQ